jgi:uncharacterized membrane protein YcaP (DUF421 family)
LIAAAVLIALNYGVAFARERVPLLRRAVEGSPSLIVSDGKLVQAHLEREGLDDDDVLMAIREHGFTNLSEVRMAVLETDGSISIVPVLAPVTRTRRHPRFKHRGG